MLNQAISLAMRSRALRIVLNALHVREAAGVLLRRWPLRRIVPNSTLVYRATTLDNLVVAREVFANGEYAALKDFGAIRSFVDLGSNCGYFTLFAAGLGDPATIKGIAVDAHPDMADATRWHIEHNRLTNVHSVWGLVGVAGSVNGSARFFVNVDAAGSSQFDRAPAGNVTENPWREIEAPTVSLSAQWSSRFGDASCDLLKVDIEGSEDAFLRGEAAFLARVGILAIEMHKWIVNVESLEAFLRSHGFESHQVLRSDDAIHVAIYVNQASRFRQLPSAR